LEKRKKTLINCAKRVGLVARQVHGNKLTTGPKGFFPKCFMFLVENFGALQIVVGSFGVDAIMQFFQLLQGAR
jgi:hypothetical protein